MRCDFISVLVSFCLKWSPTAKAVVPTERPFGANIPYQKTNPSTGKPMVFLVLG